MTTTLICLLLPCLVFGMLDLLFPKRGRWEMDWGTHPESFAYILRLYHDLADIIFGLGLGLGIGAAFGRFREAAIVLLFASIYAFLFSIWLTHCYEIYLHHRYPKTDGNYVMVGSSPYTSRRYAVTLTFAFSAITLFIAGLVGLVIAVLGR